MKAVKHFFFTLFVFTYKILKLFSPAIAIFITISLEFSQQADLKDLERKNDAINNYLAATHYLDYDAANLVGSVCNKKALEYISPIDYDPMGVRELTRLGGLATTMINDRELSEEIRYLNHLVIDYAEKLNDLSQRDCAKDNTEALFKSYSGLFSGSRARIVKIRDLFNYRVRSDSVIEKVKILFGLSDLSHPDNVQNHNP